MVDLLLLLLAVLSSNHLPASFLFTLLSSKKLRGSMVNHFNLHDEVNTIAHPQYTS